jgi:hypothetical protein
MDELVLRVSSNCFQPLPEALAPRTRLGPYETAIYGFEDSGSTHALVLELVEGPTLADRIAKGPIPHH